MTHSGQFLEPIKRVLGVCLMVKDERLFTLMVLGAVTVS